MCYVDERGHIVIEANQILAKMKNQKINYDKVLRIISQWERDGERPKSYFIVVVHLVVHIR